MHNSQLSDPLNEWTRHIRLITSKRNKTDADHEELSKREFLGSLYLNKEKRPCIPDTVIEATIISGARAFKLGKRAEAAIRVTNIPVLQYVGPTEPEELFKQRFYMRNQVNVNKSKVTRTRPMFTDWELEFTVDFQEDMISADDLDRCVKRAGEIAGIGDWRPKYGLFEVLSVKNQ